MFKHTYLVDRLKIEPQPLGKSYIGSACEVGYQHQSIFSSTSYEVLWDVINVKKKIPKNNKNVTYFLLSDCQKQ